MTQHISYRNGTEFCFPDEKGMTKRYFVKEEGLNFQSLNTDDVIFFNAHLEELINQLKMVKEKCVVVAKAVSITCFSATNHQIENEDCVNLFNSYIENIKEIIEQCKAIKQDKNPFKSEPYYYNSEVSQIVKTINLRLLNTFDRLLNELNIRLNDIKRDLRTINAEFKSSSKNF